jgi:hypothetical protein
MLLAQPQSKAAAVIKGNASLKMAFIKHLQKQRVNTLFLLVTHKQFTTIKNLLIQLVNESFKHRKMRQNPILVVLAASASWLHHLWT